MAIAGRIDLSQLQNAVERLQHEENRTPCYKMARRPGVSLGSSKMCRWQLEPGPACAGASLVSYARRQSIGASRTFAIAIVALTQASLGYAIVTGLAYQATQTATDGLKTFYVEEIKPPPPDFRPQYKKIADRPPPTAARPAIARMDAPSPAPESPEILPLVAVPVVPPAPAVPAPLSPSPPAIETVPPRSATGDLQSLFRSTDYPAAALERREAGTVTVQLTVGTLGRVSACNVTASSGSRSLDVASCKILEKRALFTPARDSSGRPTTDTVSQEIRWLLH